MTKGLTRRRFIEGNAAVVAGVAAASGTAGRASAQGSWESVPPLHLEAFSPDQFAADELDLPYYLHHFHTVANAVVESGPNRGFIDIAVWRSSAHNVPGNARIMENVIALAYFYTIDRPWNTYRGTLPVRQRIEAALDYLLSLQDDDGLYPWDDPDQSWSSAFGISAFITKFLGETLILLDGTPSIDATVLADAKAAQRKTLRYLLTEKEWYHFVIQFPNQWSNVWAGALSYLYLTNDQAIKRLFTARFNEGPEHFQSNAGFYPENHFIDWNYTLVTHRSNERMARHYAIEGRGTRPYLPVLDQMLTSWLELLSYNAVLEPDSGFILNRAVETRQRRGYADRIAYPDAETVTLARAFAPTTREIAEQHVRDRTALEATWPDVAPLPVGEFRAYSPYTFLHRRHSRWYPTDQQRDRALAQLPYLRRERFTHQRADSKLAIQLTYVRRPTYYAAFNTGRTTAGQQRLGLGLLWHPRLGAVIQTQSSWHDAGLWGTRIEGSVREADGTGTSRFFVAGQPIAPWAHTNRDLPDGDLLITYSLGSGGEKRVAFRNDAIEVTSNHPDPFTEELPILLYEDTDEVSVGSDHFALRRDGVELRVEVMGASDFDFRISSTFIYDRPLGSQLFPFEQVDLTQIDPTAGTKKLATLIYSAQGELRYRLSLA